MAKQFPNSSRPSSTEYYAEIRVVREELLQQTDRGAAIVGVAILDDRLRRVIDAAFDPELSARNRSELVDGPTAPLGTYSARCRLARAIGLFGDDLLADLKLMGRIRNRFAHDLAISKFTDDRIAPLCAQLHGLNTIRVEPDGTTTPLRPYESQADARRAFLTTVDVAIHFLFVAVQALRR